MFPEPPALSTAPAFSGHLWVQERPTGGHLGVRLADSGALTFQTPAQPTPTMRAPGVSYEAAVRFVRGEIARDTLRGAVEDPTTVALVGIATWDGGVDYDWDALPPFVGTDVYVAPEDRYLTPDAATAVIERLGLPAAPAVDKELPTRQFDRTRYEEPSGFPPSAWAPAPAAAVLVRDKTDTRAVAWRVSQPPDGDALTARDCLDAHVSPERIQQTATALRAAGDAVTVAAVRDRLLRTLVREHHSRLFEAGTVAPDELADRLGELVHRHLD